MKKKNLLLLTSTLVVFIFLFQEYIISAKQKKVSVITTLFPLYDFAKNIGGEKIEITLILSPGMEAHSFEPKPSDILKINQADLFIYTGDYMEPWVTNIIRVIDIKQVRIIDASKNIFLHQNLSLEGEKNSCSHSKNCAHTTKRNFDPHIWLDFDNVKIIIETIKNALSQADPDNANFFEENAKKYIFQICELDSLYKEKIQNCKIKKIVYGGHYAFGYLTKRYNLEYVASQGFSPDSEPSARALISIIKQIKKEGIKYIFSEKIADQKIATTIATETGVKLLWLNAAHNISKTDCLKDVSYISIMEKNLENLCIGLEYNA